MSSSRQLTSKVLRLLLHDAELAGYWTLDPARSEVRLKTRTMWGLAPVKGVFRRVAGSGTVSEAGEVSGTFTVAAGSIDTNNKKRDEHLRSADFFDVAQYPDITISVDNLAPGNEGITLTGSLAIRGRTRPLSFDADVFIADDELWLDGEVRVNRAEFGLTWNRMGMGSMTNVITVHAVFTR